MTLPNNQKNLVLAEAYYIAMDKKDIEGIAKCLHPDVEFIGPLDQRSGKENLLEAVKGFTAFIKHIRVRAKFASGNQAMIAYDADCPEPIGIIRAAALMTFKNDLIAKIELFYDARPFEVKKNEIFGNAKQ